MPKPLEIQLTEDQRAELIHARDQHPRAYVRERAAAILKLANGQSGRQIALTGLLKPRWPDTIYRWVASYQQFGLKGLEIRAGRGRKPSFSP